MDGTARSVAVVLHRNSIGRWRDQFEDYFDLDHARWHGEFVGRDRHAAADDLPLLELIAAVRRGCQGDLGACRRVRRVGSNLINSVLGMNYIYFEFGYNGFLVTVFSALGAGAAALVMLFFSPISKRFTRDQLMRLAILCITGGSAFMFLTGLLVPGGSGALSPKFALMMFGNLFAFTGQNIFYLVIMICISNTIEYNEWKTGSRAEGIIYAVRPFITKIGYAVLQGIVLVTFLLTGLTQFTNRIAGLEKQANQGLISGDQKTAAIKAVLAGVPSGKSAVLLACITILPSLLVLASYYIYSRKFTITEERYEGILADLKERKGTTDT